VKPLWLTELTKETGDGGVGSFGTGGVGDEPTIVGIVLEVLLIDKHPVSTTQTHTNNANFGKYPRLISPF
jgi:hypothetical protein